MKISFKTADFEGFLPKNTIKNTPETAFVTTDILGNKRGANTHAGAFENAPKMPFDFQPSKMKDVGTTFFQPDWANITFPPNRKIIPTPLSIKP